MGDDEMDNESDGFNFNGKAVFLTYRTWLTEEQIIKTLGALARGCPYRFDAVHEESDKKHAYMHTHILLFFEKRVHVTNSRRFDMLAGTAPIHGHVKKVLTKLHWLNLVPYIRKQNEPFIELLTGNEYEWLGTIRNVIQGKKRWRDVLNDDDLTPYIQKYMKWAEQCFLARPKGKYFRHKKLLPWQEVIKKTLYAQGDREVLWIENSEGNAGKTQLGKHLLDEGAFFTRGGKWADLAYRYDHEDVVVYDLTKTQEDFIPYKQIEMFKDGIIESNKYVSCLKQPELGFCKIVIFANYYPDVTAASIDRWNIYSLDAKGNLTKKVPGVLNIKLDSWRNQNGTPDSKLPLLQNPFPPLVDGDTRSELLPVRPYNKAYYAKLGTAR